MLRVECAAHPRSMIGHPPQHRLLGQSTPPTHPAAPSAGCHTEPSVLAVWGSGEAGQRKPHVLIKNPSAVLTRKICSVICDVIVQSGLHLEIARKGNLVEHPTVLK
ncbi:unnamed protein product [Pipistrellus nathusii]|uniref:Uncharacterized protein n=1 Tax=Pipistrellus nathusii TaxID=59473 RepID=A0ABN9ZQE5_PIPNA